MMTKQQALNGIKSAYAREFLGGPKAVESQLAFSATEALLALGMTPQEIAEAVKPMLTEIGLMVDTRC
jgi:Holliday junction resolvasome RuvABC DNA-binding subunit